MLQSHLVVTALWAVAGLATIWILGPLFLFLSPLRKYEFDVRDDPREAEPRAGDRDCERRVAELKAAGFAPVGKIIERFRFFTPLHWVWVSGGTRCYASPNREIFVELHRLGGGHPLQMSAKTVFEGGGLLATSTAAAGLGGEIGERYRRIEVEDRGPVALVREHERHVAEFSREAGLRAKAGTLAELATETRILAEPFVSRTRFMGLFMVASIYVLPVFGMVGVITRTHRPPGLLPALLCGSAVFFAACRLTVLPEFRRFRWVGVAMLIGTSMLLPLALRHAPRRPGLAQPASSAPGPR
jgi:hypothetical protein